MFLRHDEDRPRTVQDDPKTRYIVQDGPGIVTGLRRLPKTTYESRKSTATLYEFRDTQDTKHDENGPKTAPRTTRRHDTSCRTAQAS